MAIADQNTKRTSRKVQILLAEALLLLVKSVGRKISMKAKELPGNSLIHYLHCLRDYATLRRYALRATSLAHLVSFLHCRVFVSLSIWIKRGNRLGTTPHSAVRIAKIH